MNQPGQDTPPPAIGYSSHPLVNIGGPPNLLDFPRGIPEHPSLEMADNLGGRRDGWDSHSNITPITDTNYMVNVEVASRSNEEKAVPSGDATCFYCRMSRQDGRLIFW